MSDARLNEQFFLKRFFNKYRGLVNTQMAMENEALYKQRLDFASKIVASGKVDFEHNLLITLRNDSANEIFLSGFFSYFQQKMFKSYRVFTAAELLDVSFGSKSSKNITEDFDDDESINSHLFINEDILCLFLNYGEATNARLEPIIIETILTRNKSITNVERKNKSKKLTWVYFKGIEADLERKYPNLQEVFSKDSYGFDFHDLNKYISKQSSSKKGKVDLEFSNI